MALADLERYLLSPQDIERVALLGWDDEVLGQALLDSRPFVRANAIQLLSKRSFDSDASAREAFLSSLLSLASDPSSDVRRVVQAAVATESHPVAFSVLALGLLDDDVHLRLQALDAISRIPHADLTAFIAGLEPSLLDRVRSPLSDALLPRGADVISSLTDLLLCSTVPSCRRFVVFALGRFGRLAADALTPLMGALRDDDAEVRKLAIHSLDLIVRGSEPQQPSLSAPPPPAIGISGFYASLLSSSDLADQASDYPASVFVDALRDAAPEARANAARALQTFEDLDRAAIESLGIMLFDRDPTPRAAALESLRRLGPKAHHATPWLLGALSGPYRRELREHILVFVIPQAEALTPYLVEALRLDSDLVLECLRPIFLALDARSMPILGDALVHPSALIRINAILILRLLHHCCDADRVERLQALSLRDENIDVRQQARKTLLVIQDGRKEADRKHRHADDDTQPADDVIDALGSLDGDPDPEVRRLAQSIMQQLQRHRPEPPLPKIQNFDRELLSIEELRDQQDRMKASSLNALLTHSKPYVRANATLALALFSDLERETIQAIGLQTRDLNVYVRQSALRALSRLGLDALTLCAEDAITRLDDEIETVRALAQQTFLDFGAPGLKLLTDALHTTLAHDRIIPILSDLGDTVVPLLIDVIEKHPSIRARANAAVALFRLGGKTAAPARIALQTAIRQEPRLKEVAMVTLRAIDKATAPPLLLEPKPIPFSGFDSTRLSPDDLRENIRSLRPESLSPLLSDGRPDVRANAALSLGVISQYDPALPLLLKDGSPEVRLSAAQALGLLGAAALDAAPALIAALQDPSPEVADSVHQTLSALGDAPGGALSHALGNPSELVADRVRALVLALPSAPKLLASALQSSSLPTRLGAVQALGAFTAQPDEAKRLLGVAAQDSDAIVRKAVLSAEAALQRALTPAPSPLVPPPIPEFEDRVLSAKEIAPHAKKCTLTQLLRYLSDGRDHVRENVARALVVAGASEPDATLGALALILKDGSISVRIAAAQSLGLMKVLPERTIPVLASALPAPDIALTGALLASIESFGERSIEPVLSLLGDDWDRLEHPMMSLIKKQPEVYFNRLTTLSQDLHTPHHIRANAQRTLQKLRAQATSLLVREPEPMPIDGFDLAPIPDATIKKHLKQLSADQLIRLLQDGRVPVRENATRALGLMGPAAERALIHLTLRLKDASPEVRVSAVQALGQLKMDPMLVVPRLVGVLQGAPTELATQILDVLKLFGVAAVEPIIQLLDARWRQVDPALIAVIQHIPEVLVKPLAQVAQSSNSIQARENALDLLAYAGTKSAPVAATLIAAIGEKKGMVRPKAIRALASSGTKFDPKLVTQLKGYLTSDLRVSVRRAVLDALRASGHLQDEPEDP